MKNKKGFTLVELLAVIAILAILVIIALPNVIGMFNDAKKSSFMTECKRLFKIAEQTFMNDSLYEQSEKTYAKCDGCTHKQLDLSGRDNIKYFIKFNKAGKIIKFFITDDTYQYEYEDDTNTNGLLITDIVDVDEIANLDEKDIIKITNDGVDKIKEITVCYYTHPVVERTVIVRTNKKCMSNQTVYECLGYGDAYLFNNEESHPDGSNIITCFANAEATCRSSSDGYVTCMNRACSFQYRRSVARNDIVLSTSNGCYSQGNIMLSCLDGDTVVEVYDKKKKKKYRKKLKDITYDDLILCYDFDSGKFIYEKPLWIMNPSKGNRTITLSFDNGTILKVVGDHRIFDYDNGKFVLASELKVGSKTYTSDGNIIKLLDKKISEEENTAYNVITYKHINMFANNILTSQGSNNIYEIKDMKFIKEEREQFTPEELSNIDNEYIEGLRLTEWNTLDKGSKEETLIDLNNYIDNLKNNKKI